MSNEKVIDACCVLDFWLLVYLSLRYTISLDTLFVTVTFTVDFRDYYLQITWIVEFEIGCICT